MNKLFVYISVVASAVVLLLASSKVQAGWVNHDGSFVVATADINQDGNQRMYELTALGEVWASDGNHGWEQPSNTCGIPPIGIDQLVYWQPCWCIDINGNLWRTYPAGGWVNEGLPPGHPSDVTGVVRNSTLALTAKPNPSQQIATITYSLPEKAEILVQVNDVTGRVVDVLVNQWKSAGTYSQSWEPKDAPAGVYFVVIFAQGEMRSSKVVLTK